MQASERLLLLLVAILLVIVAVMVFAQYGEDGAVLFSGDDLPIMLLALVALAYIGSQTIRDKNLIASFERLQSYMSNPILMNELARRYQILPSPYKRAVDILLDVADVAADITTTPEDDKLVDRLREALESKEKSLEPSNDPATIR